MQVLIKTIWTQLDLREAIVGAFHPWATLFEDFKKKTKEKRVYGVKVLNDLKTLIINCELIFWVEFIGKYCSLVTHVILRNSLASIKIHGSKIRRTEGEFTLEMERCGRSPSMRGIELEYRKFFGVWIYSGWWQVHRDELWICSHVYPSANRVVLMVE